ncbi:outer membrane beta-barrel protein [candidate division KSB1 bacterium]|nr:outer membrane beta-barrel protein [candidate division KSB1 bacterium]
MNKKRYFLIVSVICVIAGNSAYSAGAKGDIGLGLKLGLNQFEGDVQNPALRPGAFGTIEYNLNDFFALGIESGYSYLEDKDRPGFQTRIIPFELHAKLNFMPISRINSYAILGGGGVYWIAIQDGFTIRDAATQELQQKMDSFVKAGGGFEFALTKKQNTYLSIGATYRYSMTDMLDQIWSGDENDAVVEGYLGFTYTFRATSRGDRDDDGVPDELDLEPTVPEDNDGYMDHDGKLDGVPPLGDVWKTNRDAKNAMDNVPPVVIHMPIRRAPEGKSIKITAEIFENKKLKVASILYRPRNFSEWKVAALRNMGGILFEGEIPGNFVKQQGVEYCVIAVDESLNGIGYSGLPNRPNEVEVIANPIFWRIFNGFAAAVGWGAAGYMIWRKQK